LPAAGTNVRRALTTPELRREKVKDGGSSLVPLLGLQATPEKKMSYPHGSELCQDRLGGENFASVFWKVEWSSIEPQCSYGRGSRSVCAQIEL